VGQQSLHHFEVDEAWLAKQLGAARELAARL
jgi:hypothetical protein